VRGPIRAGTAFALTLATSGAGTGDWIGKANRCISFLDKATHPVALELVDQTLAELVRLKPASAVLIGPAENLTLIIRACLAIAGDPEAASATNNPPFVQALVARQKGRETPRTVAAAIEVLKGVLASPTAIAKRDPTQEIKTTRGYRDRITKLPRLVADRKSSRGACRASWRPNCSSRWWRARSGRGARRSCCSACIARSATRVRASTSSRISTSSSIRANSRTSSSFPA
jgi:hypothetical protein